MTRETDSRRGRHFDADSSRGQAALVEAVGRGVVNERVGWLRERPRFRLRLKRGYGEFRR
jgi:hypothetical protein